MAGVLGIEPRNGGTKNRCLTAWLHPNMREERRATIGLWRVSGVLCRIRLTKVVTLYKKFLRRARSKREVGVNSSVVFILRNLYIRRVKTALLPIGRGRAVAARPWGLRLGYGSAPKL